jgi:diguanylate cyclase (GGDEF)-like protein
MNHVEHSIDNDALHSSHKSVLYYFIRIFLLTGAILTGVITILYNLESHDFLKRTQLQEQHAVDVVRQIVSGKFSTIISDISFLSQQNELHTYLESADLNVKRACAEEYSALINARGIYDQIRFIDLDGNETVRVNYVEGQAVVVADEQLQNKRGRYYFDDTLSLDAGQVFVSPFDLNMEQGAIELPLKPMIRFGAPVFDKHGNKRGVVILNYLGQNLLDELISADRLLYGKMLLLNLDGYWLRGLSVDDEWGFMYAKDKQRTFKDEFPQEWQQLNGELSGQLVTQHGLFSYSTIYPILDEVHSGTSCSLGIGKEASCDYCWILMAYIPADVLFAHSGKLLVRLAVLAILLFLLATLPSWFIAQFISQRKLKELELVRMANYDKLTNLPNRTLLDDRLAQVFHQSMRYDNKFAILFADLDGFKAVNDELGHDIGDHLLIEVAARIVEQTRRSDTVARIGGDEFVIVLTKIEHVQDAERVADKINRALSRQFTIKGKPVQIGVSIGISCYPIHGETVDELLKNSDQAMYCVKHTNKGLFKTFDGVRCD